MFNKTKKLLSAALIGSSIALSGAAAAADFNLRAVANSNENDEDYDGLVVFKDYVEAASNGAIKVDLIELACKSDFIVILCNLDSNTKGIIQTDFFSNMKKSAYIFNLSRGPVINESHLENALEAKEIAGAGLDVTEKEPLSTDSKLLKYENVIITPHALCWTDECFNDIATEAINSILNYIDKKPILNQVNK